MIIIMRTDVRILLVGEAGVGKTSLILSLVSEEFPEDVPAKTDRITIPADVTPEKVPTHIVDYSAQEQDEECLVQEMQKAHVVCIVYAVNEEWTIEKIKNYWMPKLRQVFHEEQRKPVVLVGNKSDMLDVSSMESILPIMNEYAEVETCVECSAKTLKNISEVFYYAQKAVLHPTAPLYVPDEKELTVKCKQALTRIFKICDLDNDGILNDREVYQFQRRCFNVPLQAQALEDVKAVVRKHISDGVSNDGLTPKGFLFLHSLFIQRGRHETTWTVLRKFGYDDNLQLNKDYLRPHLKVPPGCSTELTHEGVNFFTMLFEKFDEDKDGCLSPTELSNLFSTCPIMPWGMDVNNTILTNPQGWISYHGFIAQWTLTTYLNLSQTLEYLAYLGYLYDHDSQQSAIHVTRDRKVDLDKKQTVRSVFQCHVFGAKSVGKTTFLQGLLGRNINFMATLNKDHIPRHTINTIHVYGQEKYLLLQEMDLGMGDSLNSECPCDVACLLYDVSNPRSFEYIARIYKVYFHTKKIPCLVIAMKSDQIEVTQDYEVQPAMFCAQHRLPAPQMFSSINRLNSDIYCKLCSMAAYPHLRRMCDSNTELMIKVSIGVAVVTGLGLLLFKYVSSRR